MLRFLISSVLIFCCTLLVAQNVTTGEWKKLVPSKQLPKNVKPGNSNNNLDLIEFNGRYYFAFRTAPTHFASKKTKLYILSSEDLEHWELEQKIEHGFDLREPRFAVHHERLLL